MTPHNGGKQRRTVNRSGPRLTWTFQMRQTVYILYTDFDFTAAQKGAVFNSIFHDHILDCGFTAPVATGVLTAQWGERNKQTRDWMQISAEPQSPKEEADRQSIRSQIAQTAEVLQLEPLSQQASMPSSPLAPTPTPLSKRTPIGYWHAEPSQLQDEVAAPTRPRAMRIATSVEIPRTPSVTPRKRGRKPVAQKSPQSTRCRVPRFPLLRPDGITIMLPKERVNKATVHINPVAEHKAHPPLPSLLFRYWDEEPACERNSEQGFVARKYHKSNVVPHIIPEASKIDPVDVFAHMDRHTDMKSPFISTSSRLVWIVRLLLKNRRAGDKNGRVSIISTRSLDKRAVFHAKPFHDEIKKTEGFSNGAHRYCGNYEFLCWRDIPGKAIIHTFKANDFLTLADDVEAIATLLRFNIIRMPNKSLSRTLIPMMKAASISLSPEVTVGLALFCSFCGLNACSPIEHLSHIVSDIIEGFQVQVEYRNEVEWQQLAAIFAREICKRSSAEQQPATLKESEKIKLAFLDGVAWGCGIVNARFKPDLYRRKQKRAAAVGLASPARILTNQLDGVKLALMSYEMLQDRRLVTYHQQANDGPTTPAESDMDVDMHTLNIALSFEPPTPSTGNSGEENGDYGDQDDDDDDEDDDGRYMMRFGDDHVIF